VVFPPFFYANTFGHFRYKDMIKVLPTTLQQSIDILPRAYSDSEDISLVVTEDGTRKTQTISSVPYAVSGNFLRLQCTFTILTNENLYSIEVKQGNNLLYRDKLYCTSQTSTTTPHTLNSGKYNEFDGDNNTQKYIIV